MVKLDFTVIRTAATAGLLVIVPSTILAELFGGNSSGGGARRLLAFLFFALTLLGFMVAGFGAGRLRSDTPMAHGIMSALLCWAVVQGFGVLKRLAQGDDIPWVALPVLAIVAATCGLFGALFADWYRRQANAD